MPFSFDGAARNLNAVTGNIYGATVPSNPTNAGYTDPLMVSRTCATGNAAAEPGTANCTSAQSNLVGGTFHPITITRQHQCLRVHTARGARGRQSCGARGSRALRLHQLPLRLLADER